MNRQRRKSRRLLGTVRTAVLVLAVMLVSGCGRKTDTPSANNRTADSTISSSNNVSVSDESITGTQADTMHTTEAVPAAKTTAGRIKGSTAAGTAASAASISAVTTTRTVPKPTLTGPKGDKSMDNRTYDNAGRFMGDSDGPAYVVYSRTGYNRASFDILLKDVQVQIRRKSDNKFLVAYAFLGMDIRGDSGQWKNCLDAGLQYNESHTWHLFYNLYDATADQQKWYQSHKKLDPTHEYRLTLDASKNSGWAVLMAYDLTEDREADSVILQARYAKKDGSNVSFYQDYALDYPTDVKMTAGGIPSENDWEEITLYNTNENIYFKKLRIVAVTLNDQPWTANKTDRRVMWPDCNNKKINYPVVRVSHASFDTEMQIDFNMNR